MEVTITTIVFTWVVIMLYCIVEAIFTVPYDKDFELEMKKRKENEHKSTD